MAAYYYQRLERLLAELKYLSEEMFNSISSNRGSSDIKVYLDPILLKHLHHQMKLKLELIHENLRCYQKEKSTNTEEY